MADNETVEDFASSQSLVEGRGTPQNPVIPQTQPVRLQLLDLARHAVADPDGKSYVVATFDDTRLGRGYVTAAYPQQGGYLTLYRLAVYEQSSESVEEALRRHVSVVEAIQQGKFQAE